MIRNRARDRRFCDAKLTKCIFPVDSLRMTERLVKTMSHGSLVPGGRQWSPDTMEALCRAQKKWSPSTVLRAG